MAEPTITKIEHVHFDHEIQDMRADHTQFDPAYEKGATLKSGGCVVRVHTSEGIAGEYLGRPIPGGVARYLLGKNPFARERIYNDLKRGMRHTGLTAIGSADVALWDFAGKAYGVPVWQLLGGWRKTIPAYVSTLHGDDSGLGSPQAFADFAEQCLELGYPGFKIHGWSNGAIKREVAAVLELGKRVGGKMDLMNDPACALETWADALRLGRACDEAGFFWLEDPYRDGGVSSFAHKKLRELIKTPLLQTEHIFGLEQHVDFIVNSGTDFVRAGCYEDGGITGAMKVAHAAEGFGLDVEFHGGGLPHRHCIAAIRNTNYYELGLLHPLVKTSSPPVYPPEFTDELENVDGNGHVAVPQGPGLGVEMDWDFIDAHRSGETVFE